MQLLLTPMDSFTRESGRNLFAKSLCSTKGFFRFPSSGLLISMGGWLLRGVLMKLYFSLGSQVGFWRAWKVGHISISCLACGGNMAIW